MTALMLAAWGGHTDTVQALAALGADIHIQDEVSTSRVVLVLDVWHNTYSGSPLTGTLNSGHLSTMD